MSTSYILPLKAPNPLPATGVDVVTFKVWKNTLVAHIQQDKNHHHFMEDGKYSTWQAAEFGRRIAQLHDEDPEKVILDSKDNLSQQEYDAELAGILSIRNAQVSKFITHIATLCHHTENDDITNCSSSLDWIFEYLKKHYGLETKGANFMNISQHVFKAGTPHQSFYKQYRASFVDNLRKRGDSVKYKNNHILTEDEKLSPSFENAIVLWSLEKIDARLPDKVKKSYGHQMTRDVTLKDIQPVVFENIPAMLEELDQAQMTKSFSVQTLGDQTELSAIQYRNRDRVRPFKRSNLSNRQTNNRISTGGRTAGFKQQSKNGVYSGKFCRICNLAGSGPQIYTNHEIGNCHRLTMRDLESLKNSLILNGMITLDTAEQTQPDYFLQPGWDDCEAEEAQQSTESE